MDAGITLEGLRNSLTQIEPIELKGMVLLQEHRSQGPFPKVGDNGLTREAFMEAAHEVRDYVQRCRRVGEDLQALPPAPMTAFSILEYGL